MPSWRLDQTRRVIALEEDLAAERGRVRKLEQIVADLQAENEYFRGAR